MPVKSKASLKQFSKYPEVVEAWDPTSPDPKLLIYFKCLRNTVPVPSHWAQKNQYLQGRRGQIRDPFKLPDFIESIISVYNEFTNENTNIM